MMQGRIGRPLFGSTDFDGLMDDILSRRVSLLVPKDESDGWRQIDWNSLSTMVDGREVQTSVKLRTQPSPMEVMTIGDRVVHMKRDDQLRLPGSQLSGNKVSDGAVVGCGMLAHSSLTYSKYPVCNVGLLHYPKF